MFTLLTPNNQPVVFDTLQGFYANGSNCVAFVTQEDNGFSVSVNAMGTEVVLIEQTACEVLDTLSKFDLTPFN